MIIVNLELMNLKSL